MTTPNTNTDLVPTADLRSVAPGETHPVDTGAEQRRVPIAPPAERQPVHGVHACCGSCGG